MQEPPLRKAIAGADAQATKEAMRIDEGIAILKQLKAVCDDWDKVAPLVSEFSQLHEPIKSGLSTLNSADLAGLTKSIKGYTGRPIEDRPCKIFG